MLTVRIKYLMQHLEKHKKDKHNKRACQILQGKRESLLAYLLETDHALHETVCLELRIGPWRQYQRHLREHESGERVSTAPA